MTPNILLERLKEFVEANTRDLILEVRVKKGETGPKERAAEVYTMRLPDKDAETKQIPISFCSSSRVQTIKRRGNSRKVNARCALSLPHIQRTAARALWTF